MKDPSGFPLTNLVKIEMNCSGVSVPMAAPSASGFDYDYFAGNTIFSVFFYRINCAHFVLLQLTLFCSLVNLSRIYSELCLEIFQIMEKKYENKITIFFPV